MYAALKLEILKQEGPVNDQCVGLLNVSNGASGTRPPLQIYALEGKNDRLF